MSATPETRWKWRPPEGPFGVTWRLRGEPEPNYFVTLRELEERGVPLNSIVMYPSEEYLASLPADLPARERPLREHEFDALMEKIREEWIALGFGFEGPALPRELNRRQLQFVRNICMGLAPVVAYERAGYRAKIGNALRLLRDDLVVEAILKHLALAG